MKRRQGGGRGVRVNPESCIVEGADPVAHGRRQNQPLSRLCGKTFREQGLTSRLQGEPRNRRGPTSTSMAVVRQGKTKASQWKRALGVGLSHSNEETCEGSEQVRAGGAKGRAEQGTFRRER